MKLLDVSRCHDDSPEFRTGLTQLEVDLQELKCGSTAERASCSFNTAVSATRL